jgi:hypothetical protein
MTQTSVEWLYYAMQKTPMTCWYNVLEQAKEMHKVECLSFAEEWEIRCNEKDMDTKEQLYDETYNK